MNSTSGFLEAAIGSLFPHLKAESNELVDELCRRHPIIAEPLQINGCFRAAFIIPQLFLQLGYTALTGTTLTPELRRRAGVLSLMCLAVAVADDLVDVGPDDGFKRRMGLACVSLAIMDFVYRAIAQDEDDSRRKMLSDALSIFVAEAIQAGFTELEHADAPDFSLASYLSITTRKTSLYTRNSLLLADQFTDVTRPTVRKALIEVGNNSGIALQIIDDLLDADRDGSMHDQPKTYPAFLLARGESLNSVYVLVEQHLSAAIDACNPLPHPEQLVSLLAQLRSLASARRL